MNLLSVNNLTKIGREQPLFTGVTFGIDEGNKVALIGRNGTGKSTLLNTIAGVLQPDDGTVVINKASGVSYLPQNPQYNKNDTIKAHIFKSKSPKLEIIRQYEEICSQMEQGITDGLQKQFDDLTLKMENGNFFSTGHKRHEPLHGRTFRRHDKKSGTCTGSCRRHKTTAA